MLPKLLGENLCSLMSNVDRYAFSVLWKIKVDFKKNNNNNDEKKKNDSDNSNEKENEPIVTNMTILNVDYCKSIIRSQASLTYEQAQLMIDDTRKTDEITNGLRMLNRLAKYLKSQRIEKGALALASPEIKFVKDMDTQDPIDVEMYQLRDTNSMVW